MATLEAERIEIDVGGGVARGADLFLPTREPDSEGDVAEGVLVIGAQGSERAAVAAGRRLASQGFAALVPELGPSAKADRAAVEELGAAAAALCDRPDVDERSLAALGFGRGGTLAFLLGCTSRLVAAVVSCAGAVRYPALSAEHPIDPIELALNLDRPALFLFGGADPATPELDVRDLEEVLRSGAKSFECVVYPDAGPALFDEGSAGHDAEAWRDAWRRTLDFLKETLA